MTFFTLTIALAAVSANPPQLSCSLQPGSPSAQRVFTNADLERMAACRRENEGSPDVPTTDAADAPSSKGSGRARKSNANSGSADRTHNSASDSAEEDWRAQWRAIDQKARRLRREAQRLREEAAETPRDPKKKAPAGRRGPNLLIARAQDLEADARELENEFQERARREGALPGWLRPRSN